MICKSIVFLSSNELPFPAENLYSFYVDVKKEGRKKRKKEKARKEGKKEERKGRREGGRKERKRKKPSIPPIHKHGNSTGMHSVYKLLPCVSSKAISDHRYAIMQEMRRNSYLCLKMSSRQVIKLFSLNSFHCQTRKGKLSNTQHHLTVQ
jgi:hypothetical protein